MLIGVNTHLDRTGIQSHCGVERGPAKEDLITQGLVPRLHSFPALDLRPTASFLNPTFLICPVG